MPRLTDYARKGFKKRQAPWDGVELPEWWDIVVWVAAGGIAVLIVLTAVLGGGGRSGATAGDGDARPYEVQTLGSRPTDNPGALPSFPEGVPATGGTIPTVPAGSAPAGPVKDFTATGAVQVPVTGGGTTVVPAGARNVALAAARATASGDWSGIPFVGPARPGRAAARPGQHGTVTRLTVTDPAVTGNSEYRFSATVTRPGAAAPTVAPITVERGDIGYAIQYG